MSELLLVMQTYTFAYTLLSLAQTMHVDNYCFTPDEKVTLINAYALQINLNESMQKFYKERAQCITQAKMKNNVYSGMVISNVIWNRTLSQEEIRYLYDKDERLYIYNQSYGVAN